MGSRLENKQKRVISPLVLSKKGHRIPIISFLVFLFIFTAQAQRIKIACVGNSVTYGTGIKNRDVNSYPAQLQTLLGSHYKVGNFGYPGATLLKKGHKPYWDKPLFGQSKAFQPNIVIIHLGLNDQGNNNWPNHKEEFVNDYLELIATYKALPSHPRVIICKMTPSLSQHHWFEEGMRENYKELQSKITLVSEKAKVGLIDLYDPLFRFPELYSDALHPTKEGAEIIAKKIYQYITEDYGGLKLSILYGEDMVFQRGRPIMIQGVANGNDEIDVAFNNKNEKVDAQLDGKWQVTFPAMKAGGPFKLSITSKNSGSIVIDKVFVGEVWLASGQSNMEFKVKDMKNAGTVQKDSLNPNIFLFSMDGKAHPSGHVFTKEELLSCNAADYFKPSGWSNGSGEILENFSAIAYAFAYCLQKELKVPIGIICNAVGGSTTQSWISREAMETTHGTIDLLNDTHLNPMVQPWVSQRMAENMENQERYGIKARHPFDPTMLFDAGIYPIKDYKIRGVIWYQGESNAERPSLHSKLFKMLVADWRGNWSEPDMPFNFVQLSSINRPTWGRFRDAQRRLLSIPNTGMAVSSDEGNPTNVHPTEKWVVGQRLSKVALANTYGRNITFSGPLPDFVNVKKDSLEVHFLYGEGLKTMDGLPVKDIQIAGADKVFVQAESRISKDVLQVWSPKIKKPRFIKYGYTPYTNGNLINKGGLPASTFSNLSCDGDN